MVDPNALWHHSICTAIIAEYLGRKVPEHKGANFFTAGLIHDSGNIFLIEQFPELYRDVHSAALKNQIPVVEWKKKSLN